MYKLTNYLIKCWIDKIHYLILYLNSFLCIVCSIIWLIQMIKYLRNIWEVFDYYLTVILSIVWPVIEILLDPSFDKIFDANISFFIFIWIIWLLFDCYSIHYLATSRVICIYFTAGPHICANTTSIHKGKLAASQPVCTLPLALPAWVCLPALLPVHHQSLWVHYAWNNTCTAFLGRLTLNQGSSSQAPCWSNVTEGALNELLICQAHSGNRNVLTNNISTNKISLKFKLHQASWALTVTA